jgi:hypothetical protein
MQPNRASSRGPQPRCSRRCRLQPQCRHPPQACSTRPWATQTTKVRPVASRSRFPRSVVDGNAMVSCTASCGAERDCAEANVFVSAYDSKARPTTAMTSSSSRRLKATATPSSVKRPRECAMRLDERGGNRVARAYPCWMRANMVILGPFIAGAQLLVGVNWLAYASGKGSRPHGGITCYPAVPTVSGHARKRTLDLRAHVIGRRLRSPSH